MLKILAKSETGAFLCFLVIPLIWSSHLGMTHSPENTPANFKITFIGDQGLRDQSTAVVNLIESEGADVVVHSGDFDHDDNSAAWDALIHDILGPGFPYFTAIGNHDKDEFHGSGGYQGFMEARMNRLGITWDLGVKSSFRNNGIFFVLTGSDVLGSNHAEFIRDKLAEDSSIWSISSWYKNMRKMQVGGKRDEVGWAVYEESRKGGAIIATALGHSYSRTHLLSDIENQTVASISETLILTKDFPETQKDEGKTFVFVSGLGEKGIRDQERTGDWWASIYISNQGAEAGALFGVFNYNGVENLVRFYFKNIDGEMIDSFFVKRSAEKAATSIDSNFTGVLEEFTLEQNYLNSFNPGAEIRSQ